MPPPCVICVPLYIYPLKEAWEPLFRASRQHPRVQFLAIINPNSGPGQDALPDANYRAVLKTLSTIPNIRPVGYVHCSYGQRVVEDIYREIDTYREWNPESRLEGIFIDEAPSDPALIPYMASLANHVHSSWLSTFDQHGLVVYNPGVVIDAAFFDAADYVVTFEQAWDHWNLLQSTDQASLQVARHLCPKALAIVHTFSNHGDDHLKQFIDSVRGMGFAGLYITEQNGGGFTWWPKTWDRFVAALDASSGTVDDE